jgi:hypothetical protein
MLCDQGGLNFRSRRLGGVNDAVVDLQVWLSLRPFTSLAVLSSIHNSGDPFVNSENWRFVLSVDMF